MILSALLRISHWEGCSILQPVVIRACPWQCCSTARAGGSCLPSPGSWLLQEGNGGGHGLGIRFVVPSPSPGDPALAEVHRAMPSLRNMPGGLFWAVSWCCVCSSLGMAAGVHPWQILGKMLTFELTHPLEKL